MSSENLIITICITAIFVAVLLILNSYYTYKKERIVLKIAELEKEIAMLEEEKRKIEVEKEKETT